jgi:tetratricopeptide (TPR) repeat protein
MKLDKAATKFWRYINKYPKGKDTDAALYWLAFALKKQERYQEADRSLERLISEYPRPNGKTTRARCESNSPRFFTTACRSGLDKYDEETRLSRCSIFQRNPERGASWPTF